MPRVRGRRLHYRPLGGQAFLTRDAPVDTMQDAARKVTESAQQYSTVAVSSVRSYLESWSRQ